MGYREVFKSIKRPYDMSKGKTVESYVYEMKGIDVDESTKMPAIRMQNGFGKVFWLYPEDKGRIVVADHLPDDPFMTKVAISELVGLRNIMEADYGKAHGIDDAGVITNYPVSQLYRPILEALIYEALYRFMISDVLLDTDPRRRFVVDDPILVNEYLDRVADYI